MILDQNQINIMKPVPPVRTVVKLSLLAKDYLADKTIQLSGVLDQKHAGIVKQLLL